MAMETGGELPNNSAYVFDNEQHSNDPFGDASLVREEELVTLSGNGAVTHDEVVASRTNMITAAALDAVMYTSAERDSRQERMDAILSQVEALEDERERLGDQVAADERQMYHTLVQARTELWETALEGGQYLTGVDVVANAVRLSPEIDEAEPVPFCETRVRVIGELSSIIEAGVPALIVQKTGEACDTYWAATPVHDGFSIVLENDSNYGAQFMLGMNGVPAVPIVEATTVETDEATPDDRSPENTVAFIEVHTGEEVGAYATGIITSKVGAITIATQDINELDNALDVINQRPQSILSELAEKTTFREGERQGLVGIIIAAKQIEVQLSLEDDIRQQALDAISEYLLDIGDSHDNNHRALIESGFALHYIYPADAETTIVDYLIEKSNERTQQPYSRHNVSPVVTVLQQVCNMRGTIPSNLLLRGQ